MVVAGWLPLLFMRYLIADSNDIPMLILMLLAFAICIFGSLGIAHIKADFDKSIIEKNKELDNQYELYVKARTALEKYVYEQSKNKANG